MRNQEASKLRTRIARLEQARKRHLERAETIAKQLRAARETFAKLRWPGKSTWPLAIDCDF